MIILADDKIPYLKGALEPFADVTYLPGREITPEVVRDADALVVRTRTFCNEALLENSAVRFIASATIGADHIDAAYCRRRGIAWSNAPGCNADAVCQYVAAALFATARKKNTALRDRTIGVVGVGHVGSRVAVLCRALGMNVLLNDPPRQLAEGGDAFTDLERIRREADIITFHVPLSRDGTFATWHMADDRFLQGLAKRPLLINACRGEVFKTAAVKDALEAKRLSGVVIDCWEGEPEIDRELLNQADLGTPHIAGYSEAGKANGTMMSVRAVSRFFGLGIDDWAPPRRNPSEQMTMALDGYGKDGEGVLGEAVLAAYDILADDRALRENPRAFECLRGEYPFRREFQDVSVAASDVDPNTLSILKEIGFKDIQRGHD